ncbi:hypothetical protein [Nocardioides nitrophenolicus]|uniref:hypothetical protein n=1 Tax=Nocardioides nitrophenolicus TaxID=60489 RepID=UPI00195A3C56|nr:hypothetical protein [Nocardioides nitrophenolicus]MBM7516172.1 hypothetical protein [Nocardioides nitrophenolicus]
MPLVTRRTWTRAAGVVPLTALAAIAACVGAVLLTAGASHPTQLLVAVATLVAGALAVLVAARTLAPDAVHRGVGAARAAWAREDPAVELGADGAADAADALLALPRGWRVAAARGRVVVPQGRVETWVLRAARGSGRSDRRREVVVVPAATGTARASFGDRPHSLSPAWAAAGQVEEPWATEVRRRIGRHQDLPLAVVIGEQRVLVIALDDPRPETARARVELARDIAAIVGARG